MCSGCSAPLRLSEHTGRDPALQLRSAWGERCHRAVGVSILLVPSLPRALNRVSLCACSHRLNLLERVSADAVTTILHRMIEERMEQRCRGEYEHSFLNEFQEVRRACGQPGPLRWEGAAAPVTDLAAQAESTV